MEQDPRQVMLGDPLSEMTRKERRNLIGASAVGLFVALADLVPSKVSALGLEFDKTDQSKIMFGLALVVAYFLVAFMIYAFADFQAWRYRQQNAINDLAEDYAQRIKVEESAEVERHRKELVAMFSKMALFDFPKLAGSQRRVSRGTTIARATFEFLFPIILGYAAYYALILA